MNIEIKDFSKMALSIETINKKLEYLTKQLDKNKIKYPLGMTYDQLSSNILIVVSKEDAQRDFKIVRIM